MPPAILCLSHLSSKEDDRDRGIIDSRCILWLLQDAQSVAWLERTLAAFKGTVVAVTHDR